MKHLIEKGLPTKKIDFLGKKNALTITKLSQKQVKEFLARMRALAGEDGSIESEDDLLAIQYWLFREAVVEAAEMEDDDFVDFPNDDLSTLFSEVLKYSGINLGAKAEKN